MSTFDETILSTSSVSIVKVLCTKDVVVVPCTVVSKTSDSVIKDEHTEKHKETDFTIDVSHDVRDSL